MYIKIRFEKGAPITSPQWKTITCTVVMQTSFKEPLYGNLAQVRYVWFGIQKRYVVSLGCAGKEGILSQFN